MVTSTHSMAHTAATHTASTEGSARTKVEGSEFEARNDLDGLLSSSLACADIGSVFQAALSARPIRVHTLLRS